jgi:hypothetical protein
MALPPLKRMWVRRDLNPHVFLDPFVEFRIAKSPISFWVCLGFSVLSNSLWLSRMTSSYLSCNSLLAWITKQFNNPNVWFLVATSLATEKISVTTQLATQLHESRYKSNDLEFYWTISYLFTSRVCAFQVVHFYREAYCFRIRFSSRVCPFQVFHPIGNKYRWLSINFVSSCTKLSNSYFRSGRIHFDREAYGFQKLMADLTACKIGQTLFK